MPKLDVVESPVNGTAISVVTEPREVVATCPAGCTEYSTPQPELPHSCLPQPCKLNASTEPTLDVIYRPVIATSIESWSPYSFTPHGKIPHEFPSTVSACPPIPP